MPHHRSFCRKENVRAMPLLSSLRSNTRSSSCLPLVRSILSWFIWLWSFLNRMLQCSRNSIDIPCSPFKVGLSIMSCHVISSCLLTWWNFFTAGSYGDPKAPQLIIDNRAVVLDYARALTERKDRYGTGTDSQGGVQGVHDKPKFRSDWLCEKVSGCLYK